MQKATEIENQKLTGQVSLEQARYLERMNKASIRQNQNYRQNLSRASLMSEKEKYAQKLEQKNNSMQAHYGGAPTGLANAGQRSLESGGKNVPLGKYVS